MYAVHEAGAGEEMNYWVFFLGLTLGIYWWMLKYDDMGFISIEAITIKGFFMLIKYLFIGIIVTSTISAFFISINEIDYQNGPCAKRRIIDYNPGTIIGCELFKVRWTTR